jgi:quercetin dioxygenase-like cupin family protein
MGGLLLARLLGKSVVAAIILYIGTTASLYTKGSTSGATNPLSIMHFVQDSDVKCLNYAIESGNPDTGPSTHILRFSKGCAYPWHYHTAEEQLMVVQGTVSVQMDKGEAVSLDSGGFAIMPGKEPHRFWCLSDHECLAFVQFDRVYDIFWVK